MYKISLITVNHKYITSTTVHIFINNMKKSPYVPTVGNYVCDVQGNK